MKRDLDSLMQQRGLDAYLVLGGILGDEGDNEILTYMSGGAPITGGTIMGARGVAPLLVVNAMEIEEAAKSGLTIMTEFDFGWAQLIETAQGDRAQAAVGLIGRIMSHVGVTAGRVGVYGRGAINRSIEFVRMLREAYPAIAFVGETGMTLFDEAALTKDDDELARLRSVAGRTSEVLHATWDYIAGHRADGDRVVDAAGAALTIGAVKRFIRRALLDRDLEDTGTIFAQGRDGGFPHSRGEAAEGLRLGQAIIFDLFPRELGGGFHHDCTRTWSIGFATPDVQRAYDQVRDAFDIAIDTFRIGMTAKQLQGGVQDYLEAQGHPTTRSHPGTTSGYMHSLGHGVGLAIHERPSLSHLSEDVLQAGMVISIEPGLYYPDDGFGVRLEDLVYVDAGGSLVSLTDFHNDLILPLRG
ncbi:MAG: M24 family metallopeptidase [Chloroflexota bacterium]|nr:M24 family metallopeptidase [Chloroflexota bacterium]